MSKGRRDEGSILHELSGVRATDTIKGTDDYLRAESDVIISHVTISGLLGDNGVRASATMGLRDKKICCPIHQESSPSFFYNDSRGIYHCFGCGSKGSVIQLYMALNQIGFKVAVESLVKEYDLDKYLTAKKIRERKETEREKRAEVVASIRSGKGVKKPDDFYISKVVSLVNRVNRNPQLIATSDRDDFYELVDKVLVYRHCSEGIYDRIRGFCRSRG